VYFLKLELSTWSWIIFQNKQFKMDFKILSCLFLLNLLHQTSGQGHRQPRCERGSCYPATGDLLIGRAQNLSASSTCGLDRPSRYCVVSHLEDDTKCFTCDSRDPWRAGFNEDSHRIDNIVSSFKRDRSWWQAKTGEQKTFIQLDLEAEFHFTHLIMTFRTFRPKAMLIERSFDFGETWNVYRYFAQNCAKSFPHVTKRRVSSLSDVICEERYSAETPSTGGEVIFRVLPPFIRIHDPYSESVQNLLKLTNLRINFTELHTLGDTLLDSRPEISEKYYYALYDVTVRGSCSCYGHASRCLPVPGYNRSAEISRNMVHGQCECTHNTKGRNCEMCEDFYHDHPWRPARINQPNVCTKCNCNNHATECHFDAAKFQASGGLSGGVCDNCQHNTMGVNCQDCKKFYFQDPTRDIRDPGVCQPCDCDPLGAQENGLCDQVTDDIAGTIAGQCKCKAFVRGDRCDKCIENYWNLEADNPLGCQACTCNPEGTIPDLGCDEETGSCRCKRYVTGQNCDQCYPGYYGLSADDENGCKPCDCDIGGSLQYTCDQTSGQCQCRDNVQGMQCTEVRPGYYFTCLDHYKFEAEYGTGSGNARVYIREPIPDSPSYWTGQGYMKVMEGDSLEVAVQGLPFSTYYDIVIRYDPRMPDVWEDVRVSVIRPDQVDQDGLCGDFSPRDDLKTTSLPPGSSPFPTGGRFQVVSPASCLESGLSYTIRVDFNSFRRGVDTTDATLLIDSILLVPSTEYIPIYQGPGLPEYMKQEFLYHRCDILQFPSLKNDLPEQCQKHTFSISSVLHNGAMDCGCDVTGSLSVECDAVCGQCQCKEGVVGRRCDQCAPGTYGFGPQGCRPCSCHEFGSNDNFCDASTGQCTCISNVGGRTCDMCRVGFWGFPQCRPCQCNGNADTCDALTGACEECKDYTSGDFCERCEDGYYGDPRIGVRIPCKACMCPGGPNTTVQHADTCSFDPRTQEVFCNCKLGYTGKNCERCIDNYYGDPTVEGGVCEPCVCNNNINPDMPGSCDGSTGECLKCLYNSEGFACEHCQTGFYGNATMQNCIGCICNELGTNSSMGQCDRVTGQCPCLPNVEGQSCDVCAPDHWDMGSGMGCTDCGCDGIGSTESQCNQIDGQCDCVSGRGGPQCSNCEDLFYGDPLDQCIPCDCNTEGSTGLQCERTTGQCPCVDGVTGYKCDRCARGTTGDLPNCVPCGECFDNWDSIIQDMKVETHLLVKRAEDVSVSGAIKAFDEEFKEMQNSIQEIQQILSSVNYTQGDIQEIKDMLKTVNDNITSSTKDLNDVDVDLRRTNAEVKRGSLKIEQLKERVKKLQMLAEQLSQNATNIQIQEVGGAFDKIKEAEIESREAQEKVDATAGILADSKKVREDTKDMLKDREEKFNEQVDANKEALNNLDSDIMTLSTNLRDINDMVCGGRGDPCDPHHLHPVHG